ncbi:Phosphotransferase system IIC components, glucose/maltose/N-acetylglucosamine-specific [Saccharopolyspora kobensis]|uniref:Phosphotransferase system IIC components, glucose/maltose/N-acetylglucosamine-specific n=1 Tax=Saccharopolyspora kobensis TaxID=146035 RepID=A0A1H5V2Y9_9PSEU|nr:PTS sugar transporter [Saccharopolyspora kobensis]SEF81765.1 Phosphotransferase system IIC components, glucose/maltose/N-acetylglucosamine-specific [Saccharopolyspora kobensis]SFC65856.1 Phosphotransferase system IIC components, glucose/maltose/N-acetylglucosamine-specific [Saccharopolyspora kobensis]
MGDDVAATSTRTRLVAVLGSSGGNLRSHGGDDPASLLRDVNRQLEAAGLALGEVQFVSAQASMDGVSDSTPAQLWALVDGQPQVVAEGPLGEVNAAARDRDVRLSERVRAGEIDGLILISADPTGANAATVEAAVAADLPAAGTGGTSIATAQQLGLKLVAASGTTGTTSTTRAVSYVGGLARHWKIKYKPVLGGGSSAAGAGGGGPAWRRISIRGIMVGSIPAFIALALVLAVSKIPGLSAVNEVFETLMAGLPIVVAAVAARKVSALDEVGLVAGAVTGILGAKGGVLGGLAGGVLAGLLAAWLIRWTLAHRFPATTANIVTGAVAGLLPGLLVLFVLAPVTSAVGDGVKYSIEAALAFNSIAAGALAGGVIWFAIIGGVYHSVILPLVLLEMGQKGHSFFGAIDMVSLVMVSLGITLAGVVKPRTSGERALAGSGAAVNFFFGTFVEASYPFMFGDKRVFAVAIASATVGGAMAGAFTVEASAYLPAVVAPFVATNSAGMAASMVTSLALAFTLTYLINRHHVRRNPAPTT